MLVQTVTVTGAACVFNRTRLRAAYLLRLDHPNDARAVLGALIDEHGYDRQQALRLTLGAAACVNNNIEP